MDLGPGGTTGGYVYQVVTSKLASPDQRSGSLLANPTCLILDPHTDLRTATQGRHRSLAIASVWQRALTDRCGVAGVPCVLLYQQLVAYSCNTR
jgi:hypothetical protein